MRNSNPFLRPRITIHGFFGQVVGEQQQPVSQADKEALERAKYEADTAKAEADRIKRELDEIKKQLPSDEQRARWAELEAQHHEAEEQRLKKAGEFDAWRTQILDKHNKDMDAERQLSQNEAAKRQATEKELEETLIGREFADAAELFGPAGRTVLLPEVAQSYFGRNVRVEVVPHGNGTRRRVVVVDNTGTVIVDPKDGKPLPFAKAMGELIDSHPRKDSLLRGSGRVGSGSPGGSQGGGHEVDTTRLKSKDFQDPKVREAVRQSQTTAGGLQIGPAFDRMRKNK